MTSALRSSHNPVLTPQLNPSHDSLRSSQLVSSLDNNDIAPSAAAPDLLPALLYITSNIKSSPPSDQALTSSLAILLQNYAIIYLIPYLPSTINALTSVVSTLSNTGGVWDASSLLVYSSPLVPPFPPTALKTAYISAITSEYARLEGTSEFKQPEHKVVNALVPWNEGVRRKAWKDDGPGGRSEVLEWAAEAVRRGEGHVVDKETMENVRGSDWGFLF